MDAPHATRRFLWTDGPTPGRVLALLSRAGYRVEPSVSGSAELLFLDSQDGRLAKAGARLALVARGGSAAWRFEPAEGPPEEASPAEAPSPPWPLVTRDRALPRGAVEALEGAALFPVAGLSLTCREGLLLGPNQASLLVTFESLRWARAPHMREREALRATLLTIRLAGGDAAELGHLAVYVRDRIGPAPEQRDACALALEALGRMEPGGPVPEGLRVGPSDPLALAARKVVGHQLIKMRANAEGTLLDLDPEYLHDMRVATRRLRSALRLFGPALGPKRAASLRTELGWLARLLGEVRDLDVFIGGLHAHTERLGDAGRVAGILEGELRRRRLPARESLASALRSRRYEALLRRLAALAVAPVPKRLSGLPALPAEAAGPLFLGKAHRRVIRQGRLAVPAGEAPALHRLRILFKRLRYASEFFAPAMGGRLEPLIRAMVKFQDCLGEHQDAVVAARRTEELAHELADRGALPLESLLDLGGLIQVQREIAMARRERLQGLWSKFDRGPVRRCLAGGEAEAGSGLKPSSAVRRKGTP